MVVALVLGLGAAFNFDVVTFEEAAEEVDEETVDDEAVEELDEEAPGVVDDEVEAEEVDRGASGLSTGASSKKRSASSSAHSSSRGYALEMLS